MRKICLTGIIVYVAVTAIVLWHNCQPSSPETVEEAKAPEAVEETRVPEAVAYDSVGVNVRQLVLEPPSLRKDRGSELPTTVRPQRYSEGNLMDEEVSGDMAEEYLLRTDAIADFIRRFNAEEEAVEQLSGVMDFTEKGTLSLRKGLVLSLINDDQVLKNPALHRFADEVVKDSLFIDCDRYADLAAVATLAYRDVENHLFPVRLTLRRTVKDEAVIWYIIEAESPYFTYGNTEKPWYIDGAEPEIGFMGLAGHTDRSAESVSGKTFEGDGLTAYLLLNSKGLIRYAYSDQTQFLFRVGKYLLLVEQVEAYDHLRSGYLITRIVREDGSIVFDRRMIGG